ncbi:MAG: hypothetical protein AABP62_29300 [Planctomycetota bacterium]
MVDNSTGMVWHLVVIYAVVAFSLLYYAAKYKEGWAHVFAHEVGMALLVACIVVPTFEWSLRKSEHAQQEAMRTRDREEQKQRQLQLEADQKRREEEIRKDIHRFVLGYSIDSDVVRELYSSVFESKLMRENLGVTYEFRSLDPNKESLRVRVAVSYRIKNMAKESQHYPVVHYFRNVCPAEEQKDGFTACQVFEYPEDPKTLPAKLIHDFNDEKERGKFKVVHEGMKHGIALDDAIIIAPGQAIVVKYVYEVSKRFSDVMTYMTTHPAKDFRICAVLCDDRVSDLEFEVDSAHRLDPIRVSVPTKNARFYEWKINAAVLPGQGIELSWHQQAAVPAPAVDKPVANPP